MKKLSYILMAGVLSVVVATPAWAEEHATRDEAVKMVKQAVADFKTSGTSIYSEISNSKGKYVKADLYLVAYDLTGKCLAHGQNAALVGKDLSNLKDVDGKPFVKERVELASKQDSFWQDYKYMSPTTHTVSPKQSYCEKTGEVVICGGIYK